VPNHTSRFPDAFLTDFFEKFPRFMRFMQAQAQALTG